MEDSDPRQVDPYYGQDEDTDPTSLAGKIPFVNWYRKTTRGFGNSRAYFMPIAFLCLCALAFYQGFEELLRLSDWLLLGLHRLLAALGELLSVITDNSMQDSIGLNTRRAVAPALAMLWAIGIVLRIGLGALPPSRDEKDLGYVVPGSGLIGRAWGVIGKRIYQAKKALKFLVGYLRDLNLEKLYLPVALPCLVGLGFIGLAMAFENLLYEIPANFSGLADATGWIAPTSFILSAVCSLVIGIPLIANSLLRAHHNSIKLREAKAKLLRRWLKGLFGVVLVLVPVAWMTLGTIAEAL